MRLLTCPFVLGSRASCGAPVRREHTAGKDPHWHSLAAVAGWVVIPWQRTWPGWSAGATAAHREGQWPTFAAASHPSSRDSLASWCHPSRRSGWLGTSDGGVRYDERGLRLLAAQRRRRVHGAHCLDCLQGECGQANRPWHGRYCRRVRC